MENEGVKVMSEWKRKTDNNGFTLVELIVVLVILAILAAILVPALLGYIDDAKSKQDLLNAKNCMNAVQAELTSYYAKYSSKLNTSNDNIFGNESISGTNDCIINSNNKFTNNVKNKLDNPEPYCVVFATGYYGSGNYKKNNTLHDCYTICFFYYQEKEDSKPMYYYNGQWSNINPRARINNNSQDEDIIYKASGLNILNMSKSRNGKNSNVDKAIRYYLLINNTGKTAFDSTDNGVWKIMLQHVG